MVVIRVKKINPNSYISIPKFAYKTDACADVQSNDNLIINPGEFKLVSTGIKLQIDVGWEVLVRPRSGLAIKHGLTVLNSPGTIDADYRGEVKIILINHGKEPFTINVGDRIAQLAVKKVYDVELIEVTVINETARNDGGFGSTG